MAETKTKVKENKFYQEILAHKKLAEGQFVLSLYKNPDVFFDYDIDFKDISDRSWQMYFGILKELLTVKRLKVIDSIAVEEYIHGKPEKLQKFYENNGGYETIQKGISLIEDSNRDVFFTDIQKYKVILKLVKLGYPVAENWDKFNKFQLEELEDYLEGQLNSIFLEADFDEDKVEDITTGIETMVQKADSGVDRGLPLASNLMNEVQNGMSLGNITMIAANSGVGKTFLTLNQLLPTHILFKEPLLIIANEEDRDKWQKELITWQINNVQKGGIFEKSRFYQGGFSDEEKKLITNAVKWIKNKIDDGLIEFVNLSHFSMSKTIKIIKKYATGANVKYFVVDTLKLDNDLNSKITDNSWLQLQQNMVKLYNVIKPTNRNCHVWVTYQMSKSLKGKYLSQNDLGISKNVADVVSSLMLVRLLSTKEKGEGAGSLKVKNSDGRQVVLDTEKDYFVIFWDKNRQGSSSEQVVLKVDRNRNVVKDIGKVRISPEYS